MSRADDGFGNLVPVNNPYGKTTDVCTRIGGKLATFVVESGDHAAAISAVRHNLGDVRLSHARWTNGPVLAVIKGGRS